MLDLAVLAYESKDRLAYLEVKYKLADQPTITRIEKSNLTLNRINLRGKKISTDKKISKMSRREQNLTS